MKFLVMHIMEILVEPCVFQWLAVQLLAWRDGPQVKILPPIPLSQNKNIDVKTSSRMVKRWNDVGEDIKFWQYTNQVTLFSQIFCVYKMAMPIIIITESIPRFCVARGKKRCNFGIVKLTIMHVCSWIILLFPVLQLIGHHDQLMWQAWLFSDIKWNPLCIYGMSELIIALFSLDTHIDLIQCVTV